MKVVSKPALTGPNPNLLFQCNLLLTPNQAFPVQPILLTPNRAFPVQPTAITPNRAGLSSAT